MKEDYFKSGLNKVKLGFHDEAIKEFEKAAWDDPENFEIQFNLGTAYLTIGEFEQAIVNLDRAIVINPESSDALGNRAVAHLAIGEDKKSENDKNLAIKFGAFPDGLNAVLDIVRDKRNNSDPFKNLRN
jgi:tetratricopeptide (TPR) repeat protein